MKHWIILLSLLLLLGACGSDENSSETSEPAETEVSAPEGDELDPTDPSEVDEAEPETFSALMNGEVEDGEAVILSGTVDELADDAAFPAFILTGGEHRVFVRNMAETPVEVGDKLQIEGIFDGNAEEDLPLISASVITVEE